MGDCMGHGVRGQTTEDKRRIQRDEVRRARREVLSVVSGPLSVAKRLKDIGKKSNFLLLLALCPMLSS